MNSTLHKIKLITILAIGVILVACGGAGGSGSSSNNGGGGGGNDNEPIPVPTTTPSPSPTGTPSPIPTNLPVVESFSVVAEAYDSQYYTSTSNAPYYTALLLTNNGTATESLSINISGTNADAFSIVAASNQYYPTIAGVSVCPANGSLAAGGSCELMVKLNTPIVGSMQTASLNMSLGYSSVTKNLTQSPVIYVAGNFAQTYASNPIISPVTADGTGLCGLSTSKYCQLLKYDITSGQVTSVAITNNPISDIAVSPSGILTFAGGFTKAGINASNLLAPTLSNLNVMVASLNPANNNLIDNFANNESQTPNNAVNTIAYDNNGNLFITGLFTQIGSVSIDPSNSSYLVAKLDTNGNLSNALGTNGNPSGSFTSPGYGGDGVSSVYTMAFDASNNLYLAGFFTQIGSTYIDTIDVNQTPGIVRCSLVSGAYDCTPSSTNVVVTNDGVFGLALDANANIYASGVFTSVDDVTVDNILLGYNLSGTTTPVGWNTNMGASPNSIIATISVASNNQLYAGGAFSAIGNAFAPSAQGDVGTCGLNALSSNPTDACLFASYSNNSWSTIFGTDAWINTTALTSSISIQ
jgi:hypothetical protein